MTRLLLLALLAASCAPSTYGISFADRVEDPAALAQATSDDLAFWDAIVGGRMNVPIWLTGDGEIRTGFVELGRCTKIGSYREIAIDLDSVRSFPGDARRVFRHALFHELAHVHMTCTDADHSSDPTDLMNALTREENLDALPSPNELEKIRASL